MKIYIFVLRVAAQTSAQSVTISGETLAGEFTISIINIVNFICFGTVTLQGEGSGGGEHVCKQRESKRLHALLPSYISKKARCPKNAAIRGWTSDERIIIKQRLEAQQSLTMLQS